MRKVFLDANVVIQAGKPPGGPILRRVKDLVDAGLIELLSTDLTCVEVAKRHAKNDYEVIKGVGQSHFRKVINEVLGVKIPETTNAQLMETLLQSYQKPTRQMFAELDARVLEIDNIKPSTVFSAYSGEKGFLRERVKRISFPTHLYSNA